MDIRGTSVAILGVLALVAGGLALRPGHGQAATGGSTDGGAQVGVNGVAAVTPAVVTGGEATEEFPGEGDSGMTGPRIPGRGTVTNLPLPRFVSLKSDEGNARRGPSLTHRIDWVFRHRNMPLRVTAEFGHWRRVEDSEGQGGWVHYSMLSGVRTVVVESPMTDLHIKPGKDTPVMARAEAGAIARLGDCDADWCRISADGERGWVRKADIWGVDAAETRD
jgi:SH3-like domain-containing protein